MRSEFARLGNLARAQRAFGASKRDKSMKGVFGPLRDHDRGFSPPFKKALSRFSKVLPSRLLLASGCGDSLSSAADPQDPRQQKTLSKPETLLVIDACACIKEIESLEWHGSMIEIFVDQIEIR
jgi:hypothetical protein